MIGKLRSLCEQAQQIDGYLHRLPDGNWTLDLPNSVRELYSAGTGRPASNGTSGRRTTRLERGFITQKEFVADAADELRTPLAICARLEALGDIDNMTASSRRMGGAIAAAIADSPARGAAFTINLRCAATIPKGVHPPHNSLVAPRT